MSATTFTTQRQLMMKNMPAAALDNPFAKQQKLLLYVLPLVFAISGVNFPIGVLLYWLTTNAWSMGQQFYVIRRMPAPGSPAEKAMLERKRKHGKAPRGRGGGRWHCGGRARAAEHRRSASSPSAQRAVSARPRAPTPAAETRPVHRSPSCRTHAARSPTVPRGVPT